MFNAPEHELVLVFFYDFHAVGVAWLVMVSAYSPEDSACHSIIIVAYWKPRYNVYVASPADGRIVSWILR